MGINEGIISQHITHWEKVLSEGMYPYRKAWASRFFRHEPIENVIQILKNGVLLSRTNAADRNLIINDAAPVEIINRTEDAHNFVRLYFRPRNPTQYRIEGINKPCEIYMGKQSPVLVILIFKARKILSLDNVIFSDGNMQSGDTVTGGGEKYFSGLNFSNIYHEGPFSSENRDIIRQRCAEVLIPNELELEDNLQAIVCRSSAERTTLLHMLGNAADIWHERIRVFSKPGMFQNEKSYLEKVKCSGDGIHFSIHPRKDGQKTSTQMWLYDSDGNEIFRFGPSDLDPAKNWVLKKNLKDGTYIIKFNIEGCLAYEAVNEVDELPF